MYRRRLWLWLFTERRRWRSATVSTPLKVRVLDMHTLQLGRGGRWIGLGLPWLAGDIGRQRRDGRSAIRSIA